MVANVFGKHEIVFDVTANLKNHSDDLVTDLIEAMADDEPSVKAAAAFSLGHLFYVLWPDEIDTSPSIPALLRLIDHDDPRVRFEATRALSVLQVGRQRRLADGQIVDSYVTCIKNGPPMLKIEVADQLRALGILA